MLPDIDLRYFPRRAVENAIEAGWKPFDQDRMDDWAVLMIAGPDAVDPNIPDIEDVPIEARGSTKGQGARSRNLVRYAGAA